MMRRMDMGNLTEEEILEYLRLVDRRLEIHLMGVNWKQEYTEELERIEKRLAVLREKVDAEHEIRAAK